jgi:hypothetical protein
VSRNGTFGRTRMIVEQRDYTLAAGKLAEFVFSPIR